MDDFLGMFIMGLIIFITGLLLLKRDAKLFREGMVINMIKPKYYKMAVTITVTFAIITTLLVGCGNKVEPAQTTTAKDTSKDTIVKDQTKPTDTTKSESKEINMDATMKKQLDTFFSNFSEAYVEPFAKEEIEDANLIRFGALHMILNNAKLIETKGDINYGYIKAENIDGATLYFFGEKPKKHTTVNGYTYENGYYKFPKASGEVYTFSQIDKLYDLGNGTFKAEVSIYTASSGFAGDSHGTMAQWKASGEDIPTLNKKINSVIRKINDNGKERYILLEYQ